jgi:hypothetical protein
MSKSELGSEAATKPNRISVICVDQEVSPDAHGPTAPIVSGGMKPLFKRLLPVKFCPMLTSWSLIENGAAGQTETVATSIITIKDPAVKSRDEKRGGVTGASAYIEATCGTESRFARGKQSRRESSWSIDLSGIGRNRPC